MEKTKRIEIRLTEEEYNLIKQMASARGISISDLVRGFLHMQNGSSDIRPDIINMVYQTQYLVSLALNECNGGEIYLWQIYNSMDNFLNILKWILFVIVLY